MIADYYMKHYGTKGKVSSVDMDGWSGAEIKSLCRIAKMTGQEINDVSQFIVPVSTTMEEEIQGLRTWATGKTIPASTALASWSKPKKRTKREVKI